MLSWLRAFVDWLDDWIYYTFGHLDDINQILVYLIAFLLTVSFLSLIVIGVVSLDEMLC